MPVETGTNHTHTPQPTATTELTPDLDPTASLPATENEVNWQTSEFWIVALSEGVDTHLFAFHPQFMPLTRLTAGSWDDITPAINPDGSMIAFASNRLGQWDLFLLALADGKVTRLTDTPDYEASPSWSPDGLWLAYEVYTADNLDVFVQPVYDDLPAIPLTRHAAADFSPAWSPLGRQIAFVSTRSGETHIWLADLDKSGEDTLRNLSETLGSENNHPVWSPDGGSLAWASIDDGIHGIYVTSPGIPAADPRYIGGGDWPVWSPDGKTLLTGIRTPELTYLSAYSADMPGVVSLAALPLPGALHGLAWASGNFLDPLSESFATAARMTPTPLWLPGLTPDPDIPAGRHGVVKLDGVEAPYPQLHDLVDEAFQAVRIRLAGETGWDLLSTLENAFVPLTAPLAPGAGEAWLYTGRAFAFTTVPLNAGWMTVVREDFGQQTYWRVFVRARFQDGSQGRPLSSPPWDFGARSSGSIRAYEEGGAYADRVPPGYWIDFTSIAAAFGWERQPALNNWRTFYQGGRVNEFAMTGGIDWRTAMLEIYPPEVLVTPTVIIPPTRTPTITPRWYRTPTPSATATPRPTMTPSPSP
jgi:TolB protein